MERNLRTQSKARPAYAARVPATAQVVPPGEAQMPPGAAAGTPNLYERAITLSFSDQVALIQEALSCNRSQIAQILQVSRPTLYAWIDGAEPGAQKSRRLLALLRLFSRAGLTSERPLHARFVRHPLSDHGPSLLELLRQDAPPEEACLQTLVQARELTALLAHRAQQKAKLLHAPTAGSGAPVEKPANPELNYILL